MDILFKFATFGWNASNDLNFLTADCPLKIMTCDPSDDVIDIHSSLMTGVALKAAQISLRRKFTL